MSIAKWRKQQLKIVESRQTRIVNSVVNHFFEILEKQTEYLIASYQTTGKYHQPDLSELFEASEKYYEKVVRSAYQTGLDSKKMQVPKSDRKRMAKLPFGLPKHLKNLDQIFKNKTFWSRILRRSKTNTEKFQKQYLKKLKDSFDKVVPALDRGQISPQDAKKYIKETLKTSKSRAETIFRTETTNYFGRTQIALFEDDEDIIGFLFDAVRDSSVTSICRARHGLIYRPGSKLLKDNIPALHYNCRSHLIPLANTEANRAMLKDQSRNPANRAVPPLPPGWSDASRSKYKSGFKGRKAN